MRGIAIGMGVMFALVALLATADDLGWTTRRHPMGGRRR